ATFAQRDSQAAAELLANPAFAVSIDRLPFKPGAMVVGIGDSITDDLQSWLEILRHLLLQRRPQDDIKILNAGISGNTTTHLIDRFINIVNLQPDWILCMAGTKDASAHGQSPAKTLVSLEETAKNLAALRHFAASQTTARWIWMTPTPVIETQVTSHWLFGSVQMRVSNTDLVAIADMMRQLPDPVVDLQRVFGHPTNPDWLLPDGVHPSLAGYKIIVKALVEQLSGLPS
ncbi:MAG TPA: GDSL-type esterase/lipase family protein, partial [Anaerolineae bacterium]|nr:GDSL-type esterase/lipase family protein [Anaerolineae bacterium]